MIANKNTTIDSSKTVAEIQTMLVRARATSMMVGYVDGEPASIGFKIVTANTSMSFRLPSNWEGTLRALKREKVPARMLTKVHAMRVSWRVIRDWLRAQLSLIEAGVSTIDEVMLPWAITNDGSSVASRLLSGSVPLLGVKSEVGNG